MDKENQIQTLYQIRDLLEHLYDINQRSTAMGASLDSIKRKWQSQRDLGRPGRFRQAKNRLVCCFRFMTRTRYPVREALALDTLKGDGRTFSVGHS